MALRSSKWATLIHLSKVIKDRCPVVTLVTLLMEPSLPSNLTMQSILTSWILMESLCSFSNLIPHLLSVNKAYKDVKIHQSAIMNFSMRTTKILSTPHLLTISHLAWRFQMLSSPHFLKTRPICGDLISHRTFGSLPTQSASRLHKSREVTIPQKWSWLAGTILTSTSFRQQKSASKLLAIR